MWKFALVLAVVHSASCIAPSTIWVLETLKCSEHRVYVEPNRNLVETPEALDHMCKRQDEFYRCLEKLVSFMKPASVLEILSEYANERSVFNSLCSPDSPWRRRYLEFAPCINKQQTDFCKTPEFLGADGMDLSSSAHVEEKMGKCIAATLSIKCGVEAGQLFHYLLNLKGDDVCQPVEMTYTDSDTSSNGHHSTESVFGETYDQLVKKICYIPEQDSAESFVLHKRVGDMREESESVDENISRSLKIENLDPYSHPMEFEDSSENVEHAVSEDNDSVSEVTTSTLDTVDETSDEEPEFIKILNYFNLSFEDVLRLRAERIAKGPHTLPSKIMYRTRRSRTFNPEENYETVRIFPDGRINYYSRRRDIQDLENIKCYNFRDYFVCVYMSRSKYPPCLNTTVFTGPRQGEFFPEEFDPEFGTQWYETIPKESYLFGPWVHQSIQQSYKSASGTEDAQASYVPVNGGSEGRIEILEDVVEDTRIVSKDLSFNMRKDSDAYEFTTEEKKSAMIMYLFKHFTAALPSTSKIEIKNLVPENVAEALTYLYEIQEESYENVKMRIDSSANLYIFWNNHESVIDAITCGKVNECHPKGEGIWKCVIEPRPH